VDVPALPSGTVELDLANRRGAVQLARLAASDLAARAGFDIEEIEDLCRGVDELCRAVLGGPRGQGRLRLRFQVQASEVTVEGRGTATVASEDGEARRRMLDAFLDEHAFGHDGDPTFRARKSRGDQP
jgi:anti-sigma regulatory factor (Ser/Thr protein kinase)